uniref:G_PROTEIN_RECEP_F1_2 domain-containing protein n=1 Tax=Meloidogyne incognita TaxID=6306 RepID=A0A914LAI5_MELIC
MSVDLLDILFNFDYFVCLLIGFPLNIILIVLIIFKTPKEMKIHSIILLQNCVLDILMLTVQLFVQVFYVRDTEGYTTMIFPSGFLISFVKNFNPIVCNIFFKFLLFIWSLNLNGLCVQFIYRYLVLNR